jgi:branched-chain amino acid transport system permease protein
LIRRLPRNSLVMAVIALVICSLAPLKASWLDFAVMAGIFSLISLSAGLSYGQAGILSMAQGAFAAVGAYVTAFFGTRLGWPTLPVLALALILPALLAYCVARGVTRMAPLATALASLALANLVEIIAKSWDSVTGGYIGIAGIAPVPGFARPALFNILVWSFVVIAIIVYESVMQSAHGRALNVVRHDRTRAIADGVAVAPLLSSMLALSAAMAGAAGWLYVHYVTYISPQSLDTGVSISALLMAVVGGASYILGPVLGTVLLSLLVKFLPAAEAQGLFYGGALVIILVVARNGILGGLERFRPRSDEERAPHVPHVPAEARATSSAPSQHEEPKRDAVPLSSEPGAP